VRRLATVLVTSAVVVAGLSAPATAAPAGGGAAGEYPGVRNILPPGQSGSIMKLFTANNTIRRCEIALEIAGGAAAAWPQGEEPPTRIAAEMSLWRQSMSLGGGSNEIQRNIISERVLGMPREYAADRDVPYRDVRRS